MTLITPIRIVSFDAMNTLIRLKEPVGQTYFNKLKEISLLNKTYKENVRWETKRENFCISQPTISIDAVNFDKSFRKVYKRYSQDYPCFGFAGSPALWLKNEEDNQPRSKLFWYGIIGEVLEDVLLKSLRSENDIAMVEKVAHLIYNYFITPEPWEVIEGAEEILRYLKTETKMSPIVISNWDERLKPVLNSLDLLKYFDHMFLSAEVGFEKPNPEIFRRAFEKLRVSNSTEILHVGDNVEKDYLAARAAGAQSLLFRPDNHLEISVPNEHQIINMRQLRNILESAFPVSHI